MGLFPFDHTISTRLILLRAIFPAAERGPPPGIFLSSQSRSTASVGVE
jgi:hypothetical protein